jgi:exoribonuclease II
MLHPGPAGNLRDLPEHPQAAPVEEACELLGGEATTLRELAELIYGSFTPSSAWSVYTLLADGLYFSGSIDNIVPRSPEEWRKEQANRRAHSEEKEAWTAFIDDIRKGHVADENRHRLVHLEDFALGKTGASAVLKALTISATPENAHKLLLKLSHWDSSVNPYPTRLHVAVDPAYPAEEQFAEDERLDLTGLPAYAIDDEGNADPDDAISIDGDRIWIHVADVASVVRPDCAADMHARSYGATHYLPERTTTMLSPEITGRLGLGLHPTSPALSFCLTLDTAGAIADVAVHLTRVAVTRLSYTEVENRLDEPFFRKLDELTGCYRAIRKANHAVTMTFPEVRIRVVDGMVTITPLPAIRSRDIVAEAMMMAGEAAARFAQKHSLPFPFTVQPPPEAVENPATLAAMFAYRKKMKPGQIQSQPALHAGLGIPAYSRVTSPLRRYIDLVAHQQLRAFLLNTGLMDELTITNRIGAYNAVIGNVQKLERLSNLHWTLVYLLQNPQWTGNGVVVDKTERYGIVLIPALALETRIALHATKNLPLDSEIRLTAGAVDLAELSVHFTAA